MATNWDKNKPAANRSLRQSNPEMLLNQAALEDALSREHTFPGDEGTTAGKHGDITVTSLFVADKETDPDAPESGSFLYLKSGIPYMRNATGIVRVMIGEGSGATKCFFLQDTAPIGWTIVTGCDDALLAVKGGENAYNVPGGSKLKGSWTPTEHDHTIAAHHHAETQHTHTTGNHTLTETELPPHHHTIPIGGNQGLTMVGGGGSGHAATITGDTGGGQAHSHGDTGQNAASNTADNTEQTTSSSAGPATDRPLANVGIIASLN